MISASAVQNHLVLSVEKICVSIVLRNVCKLLLNGIIQKLMVDLHKKDDLLQEFQNTRWTERGELEATTMHIDQSASVVNHNSGLC